ncbi:hypothetical protein LINPERHAP1_LOCUS11509, partial [Linum perenne]
MDYGLRPHYKERDTVVSSTINSCCHWNFPPISTPDGNTT